MRWIKAKLVGVMFLLPAVAALAATTVYVSPAGNNTSPFDTWTKAATGIQPAVNVATNSDVVLVTNGPYLLTTQIVVTNGVTLRSVNGAAQTILDGQYPTLTISNRCVYLGHTNAVLDGFTVIRGCTNGGLGGGGILIGHGRAQNCTIISNYSDANGGGIYLQTGTVWNCVVATNGTVSGGGGICIGNSGSGDTGAVVSNCVVHGNYTAGWGGGIYLAVNGTIDSCVISNNVISSTLCGGGVLMGGSAAGEGGVLRNSLIVYNKASTGGGIDVWRRAVIESCTIVSNIGYGLRAGQFATPTPINTSLRNCILYNNDNNLYAGSGTLTFTNCCTSPLPAGSDSTNNIDVNPALVGGGNYRLANNSPCFNTGTNQSWMTGAVDLDGHSRIRYGKVDMGAYELIRGGTIYGFH